MSDHKSTFWAYSSSFAAFVLGWAASNPSQAVAIICAVFTAAFNAYCKWRNTKAYERTVSLQKTPDA